jgi:hypothetical protein
MEIKIHSNIYKDKFCIVDDCDFEKVSKYRWNLTSDKRYAISKINNKIQTMHQYIMGKAPEGYVIDHINNNSFDNRKINLRFATLSQNSQNIKPKNKYKGVYYNKKENKFRTFCFGKSEGQFDTEKEAAKQYDKIILKKLGNCSKLNFSYNQYEIEQIIQSPLKSKRKKTSNLPTNITFIKNMYRVRFCCKEFPIDKYFKNLNDAIVFKEEFLNKIKKENIIKEITYNTKGEAVIFIKHKNNLLECIVDEDKWNDLNNYIWTVNSNKYAQSSTNGLKQKMHRYLYNKYVKKITSKEIIDHINNNRLDNRISNLRIATHSENLYNRKIKNTSGYRGVNYDKRIKKYRCSLSKNLITYRSGYFNSAEEAAIAYDILAEKVYKNFAILNNVKFQKLIFID